MNLSSISLKLILFTIVVTSTALAGSGYLISQSILNYHEDIAEKTINESYELFSLFSKNVENIVQKDAKVFASEKRLQASINLISKYQSAENYDAVRFDSEKRKLTDYLLIALKTNQIDEAFIYGKEKQLVSFVIKNNHNFILGIQSYKKGEEDLKLYDSNHSPIEDPLKKTVNIHRIKTHSYHSAGIDYHLDESGFYVEYHQPVLRENSKEIIGYLVLIKRLSDIFKDKISLSAVYMGLSNNQKQIFLGNLNPEILQSNFLENFHRSNTAIQFSDQWGFIGMKKISLINFGTVNLISHYPLADFLAAKRKIFSSILLAVFIIAIIIIPFSLLFIKLLITTPLKPLMNGAKEFASGHYQNKIDSNASDEFNKLALTMNNMADAIEEREQRFDYAMQGANDGLWDWELKSNDIYFSPRWKSMLGYEDNELENNFETWEKLVKAEDKKAAMTMIKNLLAGKRSNFHIELQMMHKYGHYVDVLSRALLVRDEDGTPIRMVGTHVDISERKQREIQLDAYRLNLEDMVKERTLELESLNDMFRQVINTIPVRVFWKDLELNYIGCNKLFAQDAGFSNTEDLMGLNDFEMAWKDCANLYRKDDSEVIESEQAKLEFEEKQITPDGKILWLKTSKLPLRKSDGTIYGMLGTYEDITLKKELTQDLFTAMEKAEQANRSKSQFLANMSHEIRTPMNAIIGMSHLVLQSSLTKKQKNYIQKVHDSGESLLVILNDILDFSKIESGKMTLERINFRLEDVFDNIINIIGLKCQEKNIIFAHEIASNVPTALIGDPLRLGQILLNLTNNAVKFTKKYGAITLLCNIDEQKEDNLTLHFWIQDNGIGITEEQQNKLFQPFTQADASTTRNFGGSGLGLTISKNLVQLMDGKIWVKSIPNQGSTFECTIKLQKQTGEHSSRISQNNKTDNIIQEAITKLMGSNILIVEDNLINQELVQELLISKNIHCEMAGNGKEALELIDTQEFDGILMDCQMPLMDGYTATAEIRKHYKFKQLPIIALTANVMKGDIEKAKESGMDDHIAKPINPEILFTTMAKWITPANPDVIELEPESQTSTLSTVIIHDGIQLPDELPGINIQDGLKITQNNIQLYLKLLKRFYSTYQSFKQDFQQTLSNNISDAEREAHTLKGLSGNLGMKHLQHLALSLEKACKQNQNIDDELDWVEHEIKIILTSINPICIENPIQAPSTLEQETDLNSLKPQLDELKTLISQSNIKSIRIIEKLSPKLKNLEIYSIFKQLVDSIENYDFDKAETILETILEKLHN